MIAAALAACLVISTGRAQEGDDAIARAATAREALAVARAEPERVAALGVAISAYEDALAELRAVVIASGVREREIALSLAAREASIAPLLAALQTRAGAAPLPDLHPGGPLAAARARLMTGAVRARLEDDAGLLARQLGDIAASRRQREASFAAMSDGLGDLDAARGELAAAVEARATAGATPGPDPAAAALNRESESLSALAAALAGPTRPADDAADGAAPVLDWPARGQVTGRFREPDASGARRPGISLATPARALVSVPAAANVLYAGPFLDFGYVVVLGLERGGTVVLAGLASLNTETGAQVSHGDLLGLMGGRSLAADEYVMLSDIATGAGAGDTLYIEIHNGNGPIDPQSWFDAENG